MTNAVGYFLVSVCLVSVIVSVLAAMVVAGVATRYALTRAGFYALGLGLCFLGAYAFFFVLDPDPVSEFDVQIPLWRRTLSVTGFSVMVWLPVYLLIHGRLFAQRGVS